MFGGNANEKSITNIGLGINTGLLPENWFEKKNGDGWSQFLFKYQDVPTRDALFVPSMRTPDEKYSQEDCEKEFINRCKKFEEQLVMYATTFMTPEDAKKVSLPSYPSAEAFIAGIDEYVAALKALLPSDYTTTEVSVILGRPAGGEYLEFPKSVRVTGRYVKASNDPHRELVLSNIWNKHYNYQLQSAATSTEETGSTEGVSW